MRHRIAVSHASGLAAEAILEKLPESGLEPDSLFLLDDENNVGKRLAYADTRLRLVDQREFDYSQCAVLIMPRADAEVEAAAVEQGCLVLSHVLTADAPTVFMADAAVEPDIGYSESRLRLVGAEASCLLPVLTALDHLNPISRLNLTLLRSAEFHGKAGVDELASQTINLLNAREVKPSVFAEQIAFNMFPQAADTNLGSDLSRFLGTISYSPIVQSLNVPVFHGFAAAVQLEFAAEIDSAECQKLLAGLDNVLVKQASAGPISDCNQSFSCVLSHLEPTRGKSTSLQFWLLADPMRYGLANNYVNVVDFLLKSFL